MTSRVTVRIGVRIAVATALFLTGCAQGMQEDESSAGGALTSGSVLFVVGNTTLNAADTAIQQRLTALGFSVTLRKDSASTSADATGKKLVVISSTVTSTSVNTKFKTAAVPVLSWEPSLADDFGMTGTVSGTNYGTTDAQTQLSIVAAASDPMAAGFSGTQTVVSSASTFTWGQPSSGAVVVARMAGSSSRVAIYRYEKGASMVGFTAPERRVGFFLNDATASALNATGWALTDAAIRWAARLTTANGGACTGASECASGFCVSGVCCGTACTGACRSCNLPGSVGTCAADPQGTVCGSSSCSGSTFTPAATCDGTGTCQASVPASCSPFVCSTSSGCKTTCITNADCVTGSVCAGGACLKGLGASCSTAASCASGFCVDGVCCNTACSNGPCRSCNLPGSAGNCAPVAAGTLCTSASCSGSAFTPAGTCDGAGSCGAPLTLSCAPYACTTAGCKSACTTSTDCAAGHACVAGQCS